MFKVGETIVCAYAVGTDNLTTHGEYEVKDTYMDSDKQLRVIIVGDVDNTGDYLASRFMSKDSMVKQVLENARND